MERRNWSPAQLARACGISPSTLYPVLDEKQLAWPQPATLARLADGLGTTVAALISEDAGRVTPADAIRILSELAARASPDRLADRVSKLSAESRQYVEDLVQGLEDSPPSPEPDKGAAEKRK